MIALWWRLRGWDREDPEWVAEARKLNRYLNLRGAARGAGRQDWTQPEHSPRGDHDRAARVLFLR